MYGNFTYSETSYSDVIDPNINILAEGAVGTFSIGSATITGTASVNLAGSFITGEVGTAIIADNISITPTSLLASGGTTFSLVWGDIDLLQDPNWTDIAS